MYNRYPNHNIFIIFILLFILFMVFTIAKKKNEHFNSNNKLYAVHAVFISKENIMFLEEWIDYHIQIGFNRFYLYDNSKVTKKSDFDSKNKNLKPGKVNKYNIDYNKLIKLSQKQINEIMEKIVEKYEGMVNIIEWSPKDKDGNVLYNQVEAHNHCLKRMKLDSIDWCASIDIDEFINLKNIKYDKIGDYLLSLDKQISAVCLDQVKFENRFNNMDKNVIEITNSLLDKDKPKILYHDNKNIFKIVKTTKLYIHVWTGNGKIINPKKENDIFFNHYKLNNDNYKTLDNISPILKKTILKNSKKYIKHQHQYL